MILLVMNSAQGILSMYVQMLCVYFFFKFNNPECTIEYVDVCEQQILVCYSPPYIWHLKSRTYLLDLSSQLHNVVL